MLQLTRKLALLAAVAAVGLAWTGEAHAQYRNNGIYFEAGVQSFEFMPYTAAAFGTSYAVYEGWGLASKQAGVPGEFGPVKRTHCGLLKPYQFPCINNWFGLTDGPYVGAGFQRVIGDLLVDLTESPLLKSIVLSYATRLGVALTLAGGAHLAPVFIVHQDVGLRWNILDEKIRPYIGVGMGFNLFVDPFGLAGRVNNNRAQCGRAEGATNSASPQYAQGNGGCVDGPGQISFNAVNPQAALFYLQSFPVLLSFPRPEAGIEYFFMEDISVQAYLSPAVYFTILPQFILRPPFAGFSMRGGANVVFYF